MRYLTYELFLAQNDENMSLIEEEQIHNLWDQNVIEYRASYKAIANRVSNAVYQHFGGMGFHDYHLLCFDIDHDSLRKINLKLTLSNEEGLSTKVLRFSEVSSFEYHHKNFSNEKSVMNRDIDIWLYEEFLSVDSATLSFEVIFSSGASIAMKFPNHAVSII